MIEQYAGETSAELELRWTRAVIGMLPAGVWQAAIDAFTDKANREIAEAWKEAADADPDNEFIQMVDAACRQEPQP